MSEEKQPLAERVRLIRWRMSKENLRFIDEIRIIPRWLVGLVVGVLVTAEVVAQIIIAFIKRQPWPYLSPGMNALALGGVVTGVGVSIACLVFLFAYVNRDAKRRGMNSTLWTLLAIFVPYLIGLIVYFLLREPLPFKCPQCGAIVSARFNFCPSCKNNLRPTCPECKREVRAEDRYCPHCAHELTAAPGS